MADLKPIEPIEQCMAHASDGSEVGVVGHILHWGAYISFLREEAFTLTAARAWALGKRLVKLGIEVRRSVMDRDRRAGKPPDLIEAELLEEGGREWCMAVLRQGVEEERSCTG